MVGLCQDVANVGPVALPWLGGISSFRPHLRFAAGVCVLAAALLMGGAWVASAVANADSSNSAAQGDGRTNSPSEGSNTASGPVGHVTHTQRKKFHRVTSTLGSGRQTGRRPLPGAKWPKPGGTDTRHETKDSDPTVERVMRTPDSGPRHLPGREKAEAWRHGHQRREEGLGPRRRGFERRGTGV